MTIQTVKLSSPKYPALLREIHSPPKQLFYLGTLPEDNPCVAIVGSRKFTPYGREVTQRLAGELAACGITIVNGLAMGIDAIAQQAALDAGGKTVAIMGGGLNQISPTTNRNLAVRILAQGGAIISEYAVGMPTLKQNFVARNRIVAGLSLAAIVTEAAAQSGTLITANFALEQNRLVMAVPGNVTQASSAGANNLIKAGGIAVTEARDVLMALDMEVPELKAKIAKPASEEEAIILELLGSGVNDTEELIEQSKFETSQFNHVISLMEISGKVRCLGGSKWIST